MVSSLSGFSVFYTMRNPGVIVLFENVLRLKKTISITVELSGPNYGTCLKIMTSIFPEIFEKPVIQY